MNDVSTDTLLLPLREEHGRLRHQAGSEPLEMSRNGHETRSLLADLTTAAERDVEIRGQLYLTSVHIMVGNPRLAYVETDRNGVPVANTGTRLFWDDAWTRSHCERLSLRWRKTEGLTTDTELPVDSYFVAPEFEYADSPPAEHRPRFSWERLKDHARVVIIGAPGAGKTTVLRRILQEATASARQRSDTVPIYLQLRNFKPMHLTVAGLSRLLESQDTSEPADLKDIATSQRIMLLLDGLDEVADPAARREILDRLTELCAHMRQLRVRLTSREATYANELQGFVVTRLLPFSDSQVQQWSRQFVATRCGEDVWRTFTNALAQSAGVSEMASNPLLLSMISSSFAHNSVAMNDEASIYGECLNVLVRNWDKTRSITRYVDPQITPRLLDRAMSAISARLTDTQRTEFTLEDVAHVTSLQVGIECSPLVVVDACRSAGIVRPSGSSRYQFTHRSFQEYLAARHLVDSTADSSDYLQRHGDDPLATRVWTLSCSMASQPEPLLVGAMAVDRIPEWRRAALLADVLTNEIVAEIPVARRCCDYVVSFVEEGLRAVLEDPASSPEPPQTASSSWSANASMAVVSRDTVDQLGRIMWAIHRCRNGSGAALMRERLLNSDVGLLPAIADAMDHEGHLTTEVLLIDHESPLLHITVSPEFPAGPFYS
jgi:hypothetical protein